MVLRSVALWWKTTHCSTCLLSGSDDDCVCSFMKESDRQEHFSVSCSTFQSRNWRQRNHRKRVCKITRIPCAMHEWRRVQFTITHLDVRYQGFTRVAAVAEEVTRPCSFHSPWNIHLCMSAGAGQLTSTSPAWIKPLP